MAAFRTLDDLEVRGKRALVRVDFNVPMHDGAVTDATRIERGAVTLKELMGKGAKVVALSHFGRPKGKRESSMSLAPIAKALGGVLGVEVAFAEDCVGEPARKVVDALPEGGVALLENLRFPRRRGEGRPGLRRPAGVPGRPVRQRRLLGGAPGARLDHGPGPAAAGLRRAADAGGAGGAGGRARRGGAADAALIGGAKISSKLEVIGHVLDRVDVLVIGGGMANTFLNAQGFNVGKSLCERDLADDGARDPGQGEAKGARVVLPVDAVVALKFEQDAATRTVPVGEVGDADMILDVGPMSVEAVGRELERCRTLLWNGPMGAFEIRPFDEGTNAAARKAAELTKAGKLKSVAGGGDTVAALAHAGVVDDFSYVSTAGGAFLEWLEGKELPGVAALAAT
jgi:phosphoglycerate kinase